MLQLSKSADYKSDTKLVLNWMTAYAQPHGWINNNRGRLESFRDQAELIVRRRQRVPILVLKTLRSAIRKRRTWNSWYTTLVDSDPHLDARHLAFIHLLADILMPFESLSEGLVPCQKHALPTSQHKTGKNVFEILPIDDDMEHNDPDGHNVDVTTSADRPPEEPKPAATRRVNCFDSEAYLIVHGLFEKSHILASRMLEQWTLVS